jgi:hypothetical protein
MAQDHVANRRHQRASLAATGSHISRLHRSRSAAAAYAANAACNKEIAATLNQEGFVAARGCKFKGENVLGEVDIVPDQIQHKRAKWSSATGAGRWSMIVLQRTFSDAHFRLSGKFMTACLSFPDFVLTYFVE